MAVLITGATGLIGRAVTKSYLDDQETVHVLTRDTERAGRVLGPKVRLFAWQPSSEELPLACLEDVQTIFHLMGEPVGGRWTKAKVDRIVSSRIISGQKLAQAIKGKPCHLISASSFGIYDGVHGETYEDTQPLSVPQSQVQTILQKFEAAVAEASSTETKVNMVRFGMVCSPEGYPKKLTRLFRKGTGFMVGSGEQTVPIVDIEDAVGMLRFIATGVAGEGPVNCVAPVLPRYKDVAHAIANHLGVKVRFHIPTWLARPLLGGSADYFLLSYDVKPRKALDRGYNFRHSDPQLVLERAIASA